MHPPLADRIAEVPGTAGVAGDEQRELNENNRDLLDMLLRLVNNSVRVITNLMSADSDYIGSGQRNPARMTGAVVCMKG